MSMKEESVSNAGIEKWIINHLYLYSYPIS